MLSGLKRRGISPSLLSSTMTAPSPPLDSRHFYAQFHGHPVDDLAALVSHFRAQGRAILWTAGDSSLDNKFWFGATARALHGYEAVLSPPSMKQDVTYWANAALAKRGADDFVAVNTAVEATSLNDRACGRLLAQDELLRDEMAKDDVLVVSVGGNDIALQPLLCTVCSMLGLVWCGGPTCVLERAACACPPNTGLLGDLGCWGCGVPNCVTSCLCGFPLGFGYVVDLFKNRVENYVRRLVAKTRPRKVLVCMIYFLDEQRQGSWADGALACLCYDAYPQRLQAGIEAAFLCATSKIRIPGTEVVPVPLFRVLDGKTTSDYCQRVEPSPSGGEKLAEVLVDTALGNGMGPGRAGAKGPIAAEVMR